MSDLVLRDAAALPSARCTPLLAGINRGPALCAAAALVLGAFWIAEAVHARQALLFALGAALGLVLYHANFGFTAAWRVFIADRRGAGLRAQMAMLALAVMLFFPALAAGSILGQSVSGIVAPAGVGVLVGAFLFGIGMQLGGGCASGTLYALGGGSTRMAITLTFFVIGSTIGAAHLHWWNALPSLGPVSLLQSFGLVPTLAVNLLVFAAVAGLTLVLERRRHGRVAGSPPPPRSGLARLLRGPWPLIAGALALAVLNFATLALSGRPWGITSAFALWGSKAHVALGGDTEFWPYWSTESMAAALEAPILADVTSVMDFGLVLGALLAAALAGRFAPEWRIPLRAILASVLGGMLLGYGARLGYGCNIGAFFSGIASGSLHGWMWIGAAFLGNL
ncbi:MAG TPA: YeeE/YedE family protein, partial [Acetobacteraceae bacterium]|nr:YeeE/YedE family protein [Acetobacteraceae bacterium]